LEYIYIYIYIYLFFQISHFGWRHNVNYCLSQGNHGNHGYLLSMNFLLLLLGATSIPNLNFLALANLELRPAGKKVYLFFPGTSHW